jgi:hypothetical protein
MYYSFVFHMILGISSDCFPKLHYLLIERISVVVTSLTAVRVVLGSNLGLDTGYPDCCFCGFAQSRQGNAAIVH